MTLFYNYKILRRSLRASQRLFLSENSGSGLAMYRRLFNPHTLIHSDTLTADMEQKMKWVLDVPARLPDTLLSFVFILADKIWFK